MVFLRRRDDLVCRQVVELVTDYLEGVLPRRERHRFERHLEGCPNCSLYLEQIRVTIAETGRMMPGDLTPGAREELSALYRAWLDDGPGEPAGGR